MSKRRKITKAADPELMAALNKWAKLAHAAEVERERAAKPCPIEHATYRDYWVKPRNGRISLGTHVVLVGDIVSGFEAYGPFPSGHEAVMWKQQKGVRELTQGQWFIMPLREPT